MNRSALQIVKPETLRAQVENQLRAAIVNGELPPGAKLIERELCEKMGVSRSSLREALRKLEAEKLIVNIPHRGPEVASLTMQEASELYALRRLLESYAAHEFTRLATDKQVEALAQTVERLRLTAQKNNRSAVLVAKAELYSILLGGCGNALVQDILGGLLARVSLLRSTSLMLPDRLPRSIEEIDELLQRIQARDAKGAGESSYKHVQNAEIAALGVFKQQISPSPSPSPTLGEII
jgi:DNA-binding GntR family transcriptional regulator